jgi:hypothetical protein
MADRYWVGGTGTWNAVSTANWAASSGGASGASAPTLADNVFFDANSNVGTTAFTLTITAATCLDFTASGLDGVMTVVTSGTNSPLDVYGSMSLPASNLTWSPTTGCALTFRATTAKTLTTNGVVLNTTSLIVDGVSGTLTLGSALSMTSTRILTVSNGTFSTSASNYSMIIGAISSSAATVRTINLNASAITLTGTSPIQMATTTNLTFTAGTSTITLSNAAPNFVATNLTFYNVSFTSTTSSTTPSITGSNTYNNFSFTSPASGIRLLTLTASQTINGTLTLGTANTPVRRIQVVSATAGTQITLTVATIATLTDCDFRDIVAAGASGTWSGTRLGNGLNNSNITFVAGKTVYFASTVATAWNSTVWSNTSGGTTNDIYFPLAQDTAIINDAGLVSGATSAFVSSYFIGTLDCSSRTLPAILNLGNADLRLFGDIILSSAISFTVTVGSSGSFNFYGFNKTINVTTSGAVIPLNSISILGVGGTVRLVDSFTQTLSGGGSFTLTNGTLNLNNNTLSVLYFNAGSGTATRNITFGTSGKILVTGSSGTVFLTATTGFTVTGTTLVEANYSGSVGTRSITLANVGEANAINFKVTAGSDVVSFGTTSGSFKDFDLTGFTGTATFNATPVFYGNFDIGDTTSITGTGGATFRSTLVSTQTIRFNNANNLTVPFTVSIGVGAVTTTTYRLTSSMVIASINTLTVSSGTLDLNGFNITTGLMTCAAVAHTLAFGTNTISLSGTGTIFTGSTTTTVTGTPLIICTNSSATARVFTPTAVTEANSISFRVTAGTGSFSITSGGNVKDLDFTDGVNPTGFAGTFNVVGMSVFGNFKASTGMTQTAGTSVITFAATSGTKTITTAGVTFDRPFTFNGLGGTWQLQDALTLGVSRTCTLTAGTLNLNNYTLTSGLFSSNNTNIRSIAFGTSGKIVLSGSNASILSMSDATNFTTTGTSRIECSYSGSVGTRTVTPVAINGIETNALSIYAIAGSDTFQISGSGRLLNFDLTGFAGALTIASTTRYFGNFVLPPTLISFSVSGASLTFSKTTGTQTLTTSGFTVPTSLTLDGVGGTLQLIDNLTVSVQLSVVNGTFDADNKNVTVDSFNSSYSSTRTIALGSGTWTVIGTGTVWNTTTTTGLTVTGTAFINCTSASAKTFAGGSASYSTLNNGGSGALTISGNGTYDTISNTVQPTTITFTSGATKTITNFNVSGTAGNLVTINSSTSGSAATITKPSGNVLCNFVDIQDSTATGGSGWYAQNSTDSGNNTGWVFQHGPYLQGGFLTFFN